MAQEAEPREAPDVSGRRAPPIRRKVEPIPIRRRPTGGRPVRGTGVREQLSTSERGVMHVGPGTSRNKGQRTPNALPDRKIDSRLNGTQTQAVPRRDRALENRLGETPHPPTNRRLAPRPALASRPRVKNNVSARQIPDDLSPSAKRILNFLYDRKDRGEVLLGQFLGSTWNLRGGHNIYQKGFKYPQVDELLSVDPALVGFDYLNGDKNLAVPWRKVFKDGKEEYEVVIGKDGTSPRPETIGIKFDEVNERVIEQTNANRLVTISTHFPSPISNQREDLGKATENLLEKLLEKDTPEQKKWFADLDKVGDGLEILKRAGVVVLWRPLHEMNGRKKDGTPDDIDNGWFWWGDRNPEKFRKVWIQMYDRFHKRGLNNLLWVFSPNAGKFREKYDFKKYYPGDEYVHVVSLDLYGNEPQPGEVFEFLTKIKKPLGIETGAAAPDEGRATEALLANRASYLGLLNALKAGGSLKGISYIQIWDGPWALSRYGKDTLTEVDKATITGRKLPENLVRQKKKDPSP